jgi:uncharacterized DUF497 family protein
MEVEVEYDDDKDAENILKHGVSLALGALVIRNSMATIRSLQTTGEARYVALARIEVA